MPEDFYLTVSLAYTNASIRPKRSNHFPNVGYEVPGNPLGAIYSEVSEVDAACWLISKGKANVAGSLFPASFAEANRRAISGER